MAEDMKRNNGFIPGIKPGKNTAEYLDVIMSRITLPGSIFLAIIAILPGTKEMAGRQDHRICNEMGTDHESSCEWFYDSRYENKMGKL